MPLVVSRPALGRLLVLFFSLVVVRSSSGVAAAPQSALARQEAYVKASNPGWNDASGEALAIDGDRMVIGAPGESSGATGVNGIQLDDSVPESGAAYVFVRTATGWRQEAYLKASNTDAFDGFGSAVALAGDLLVVGAPQEDSSATGVDGNQASNGTPASGAAYVFQRTGGTWAQVAYLKQSNTTTRSFFGQSLAVHGSTIVVGASGESSSATGVGGNQQDLGEPSSGAVYVFERDGTTWRQTAYVKASNTERADRFGLDVAVSSDTLVAGAWGEDSAATGVDGDQGDNGSAASGATYVFRRAGTSWVQEAYLKASNTGAGDAFGWSVALHDDRLAVGAYRESSASSGVNGDAFDDSSPEAGAVYLFRRTGAGWRQEAYVKASNPGAGDWFGHTVDLSGPQLVVGAQHEASSATVVDGDQGDDSAFGTGAAYWFERTDLEWDQRAYLKASNAELSDWFGSKVAVSQGRIVVAARGEDGCDPGVGGNEDSNSCSSAGASYVFDLAVGSLSFYCFGAGCPCGNDSEVAGCANSTGGGAVLRAAGSARVSEDDLVLVTQSLPPASFGTVVMGSAQTVAPFGNGLACVGGSVHAFPPRAASGGTLTLGPGIVLEACNLFGSAGCLQPGATWHFQAHYRDDPGPCGSALNSSNALAATFAP